MAKIEILESAQRELEAIAELHMNLAGPNSARKITDRILDSLCPEFQRLFPLFECFNAHHNKVTLSILCNVDRLARSVRQI